MGGLETIVLVKLLWLAFQVMFQFNVQSAFLKIHESYISWHQPLHYDFAYLSHDVIALVNFIQTL